MIRGTVAIGVSNETISPSGGGSDIAEPYQCRSDTRSRGRRRCGCGADRRACSRDYHRSRLGRATTRHHRPFMLLLGRLVIGRADSRFGTVIAESGSIPAFKFATRRLSQMGRKATRSIGTWLILIGIIGLLASIIWWDNFYGPLAGQPPAECLYQLTGSCRMVSDVAGFFGAASYDARLFWASGIAALIGVLLQR
jgi:hypothetical protein